MLQNKIISTFRNKQGRPLEFKKFPENAIKMIDEINAMNPDVVLDLGCGTNLYKNKINNLVGVDILDRHEDITCAIEDLDTKFDENYADIVLALGSINFGNDDLILKQIKQVKRVCKPGGLIYFRCNPISTHEIYFQWDFDKIDYYTKICNFEYVKTPRTIKKVRRNLRDKVTVDSELNRSSNERIFLVWKNIK